MVEIVVVLVATGLIAAIGLVSYTEVIKKAADREAKASLMLIQTAQAGYHMEHLCFYPCASSTSNLNNINNNLRLSLPTSTQWTYTLYCTSAPEYATATREGRTWRINFPAGSDENPICTAGCP